MIHGQCLGSYPDPLQKKICSPKQKLPYKMLINFFVWIHTEKKNT